MHDPVQITILEERKLWGMLPKELAYNAAKVSFFLAAGFVLAAFFSHQWWFLIGTVIAGVISAALLSLSTYLRDLAYENADLAVDTDIP